MDLTIDALSAAGAFTSAPVRKEITWRQGDNDLSATVYVRPLSYAVIVADIKTAVDNGDAIASRIAASIVSESGAPVFTPADIVGTASPDRGPLNGNLVLALLQAIGEVNGMGKGQS